MNKLVKRKPFLQRVRPRPPPACLPACLLACLPACLLACLLACLPYCRTGLPVVPGCFASTPCRLRCMPAQRRSRLRPPPLRSSSVAAHPPLPSLHPLLQILSYHVVPGIHQTSSWPKYKDPSGSKLVDTLLINEGKPMQLELYTDADGHPQAAGNDNDVEVGGHPGP